MLDRCDEILRPVLDRPLLSAIYPDDGDPDLINNMLYAQPGLFAVEYALAQLWRSWGIEPVAVLGHSLGEYVAACFAGVMSLEDGLRLVAERGRLLQRLADHGAMATIFASRQDVAAVLDGQPDDQIAIAAANGPANTTISGVRAVVEAVCATFTARGVDVRMLRISTSSHSPLIEPVLQPLRAALDQVTFTPPRIPLVSNLTGQLWPWDKAPDADYWCDHARQPVLFADGVQTIYEMGYQTFLEVGPAPTLLGLVGEILPPNAEVLLLASLRPKQPDWDALLTSMAQLYVHGADLDWSGFDADHTRRRVPVPHYPFDRVRCWHDFGTRLGAPTQISTLTWPSSGGLAGGLGGDGAGVPQTPMAVVRGRMSSLPTAEELRRTPPAERLDALLPQLLRSVGTALGSQASAIDPDLPLARISRQLWEPQVQANS